MPHHPPERLWRQRHRKEMKYGDRLAQAAAHAQKADACSAAIRRLRELEKATRPKQAALF